MIWKEALQHIKENSTLIRQMVFENNDEGIVKWQLRLKGKRTFFLIEYPGAGGFDIYFNDGYNNTNKTIKKFNAL